MPRSRGTIVRVEVGREISKEPHRNVPDFPADLSWQIEDQKTVDACLIVIFPGIA